MKIFKNLFPAFLDKPILCFLFLMQFGFFQRANGQPCEFTDIAVVTMPNSVDICEFSFPVAFSGLHLYSAPHAYTVAITYESYYMAIDDPSDLTGLTIVDNGNGTETDFADNYIGVNFDMLAAPYAATLQKFEGNHFFTENGVKQPFAGMPEQTESRGYCGIFVYNYKDFNIWDGNHFPQLANGIIGVKTPTNMGNMTFDDMNSVGAHVYKLEGYGIYVASKGGPYWANLNEPWMPANSLTFNNCKVGAKAIHYGGGVDNAVMTNVGTGIDWENSQGHLPQPNQRRCHA